MNKKSYQRPTARIVTLQHQSHILSASDGQAAGRPSASFMSNPGIGSSDDE